MIKFLVDEDLPRSAVNLIRTFGHLADGVNELGLRGSKDKQIADYVIKNGYCILTGDYDFSHVLNYPPKNYHGIIVLYIPGNSTSIYILNLLEIFLKELNHIKEVSGRLIIVESNRIRIRSE
ncbi:hypothetical protein LDC_0110 [sediment metagenome]|uniref:DUF5615 domain-containing protein n=1 Tax=sediment metagenome TaxID=749907 RepID=D9PF32_9ZZZZ